MRFDRVLIARKKTAWEHYSQEGKDFRQFLSAQDLEVLEASHRRHHETVLQVKEVLGKAGATYREVPAYLAEPGDFLHKDLVVTIGGDGTLLYVARYLWGDTPVMTVRSDHRSCGALCSFDGSTFAHFFEKLLRGEALVEKWTRIAASIGSRRELALNEIYVGTHYRPQQARYVIQHGDVREEQRSSGLIVSTGAGSTGWYSNIAESGGAFGRTEERLRYVTTEYDRGANYSLASGKIEKGERLSIRSIMNSTGRVSFDGDVEERFYPFYRGQTLEIEVSEHPLHVVRSSP